MSREQAARRTRFPSAAEKRVRAPSTTGGESAARQRFGAPQPIPVGFSMQFWLTLCPSVRQMLMR